MADNRLMVDFSTFKKTCGDIEGIIGNFRDLMGTMKGEIEDTKNNVWDSDAGKLFRQKYDNCNGEVMDCINYLMNEFLRDLNDAAQQYEQLEIERNQTGLVNTIDAKDIF